MKYSSRTYIVAAIFFGFLLPIGSMAQGPLEPFVIYGSDDRREGYEGLPETFKNLARATVALVQADNLTRDPGSRWVLKGEPYGKTMRLCRSERFREQTSYAFCSGVLIEEDLVLTAGHCVPKHDECRNSRILFDLVNVEPLMLSESPHQRTLREEQVFECQSILAVEEDDDGVDYALIRLDRPVSDREPVRIEDKASVGTSVFMLGHPMGLPLKRTGGARILKQTRHEYITDLDSYGGNSGSPVFSSSGRLLGLLTGGEEDFEERGGCQVSRRCTRGACMGESVLKLSSIPELSAAHAP